MAGDRAALVLWSELEDDVNAEYSIKILMMTSLLRTLSKLIIIHFLMLTLMMSPPCRTCRMRLRSTARCTWVSTIQVSHRHHNHHQHNHHFNHFYHLLHHHHHHQGRSWCLGWTARRTPPCSTGLTHTHPTSHPSNVSILVWEKHFYAMCFGRMCPGGWRRWTSGGTTSRLRASPSGQAAPRAHTLW